MANKVTLGDLQLNINKIHLDPENPRHPPLESDAEIIKNLCSNEYIRNLAKDIAEKGALNPLETIGVIPYENHPGHYIAVEGNRRICSLILLRDPSRAPTKEQQTYFKKLNDDFNIPKTIRVHVFANRQEAKPWIDLRHLGEQSGVGTRRWTTEQQTRAIGNNTKSSSNANRLAVLVLDRLVQQELLAQEQRDRVSITTITRYLGNPAVRGIFGLSSNKELVYTHEANEVEQTLLKLVKDSIIKDENDQFKVNSRAKSAEQIQYAQELQSQGLTPKNLLPNPKPMQDVKKDEESTHTSPKKENSNTTPTKKRSSKNPANLTYIFSRSFEVSTRDPVLSRLRAEAITLKISDFPFSANYLLRAFIERTLILFLKKRGVYSDQLRDNQIVQKTSEQMKNLSANTSIINVVEKAASDKNCYYSLHSIGHAVHGGAIPSQENIRAISDTWLPVLEFILKQLE